MSASRDNPLWLQLWRDRQTDFHQTSVNPLLSRFWPSLDLASKSRILVPLCGKSLDMLWLAEQGHEVVGIELSPLAVKAFFKENRLKPTKKRIGDFTCWQHGNIRILCGDYFALTTEQIGPIDTVYDRAALTALPEDIRPLYVAKLREIIPCSANIFLLTIEDADAEMTLKQALGVDDELKALYAQGYNIELTHVESVYETDPQSPTRQPRRAEYKVYTLTNRDLSG